MWRYLLGSWWLTVDHNLYRLAYCVGMNIKYSGHIASINRLVCEYVGMRGSRKFCQRGSKIDGFFLSLMRVGRIQIPHYKRAINGPSAKRHLNGVSLAGRWWPNIECWIGSFVILRGSGPVQGWEQSDILNPENLSVGSWMELNRFFRSLFKSLN